MTMAALRAFRASRHFRREILDKMKLGSDTMLVAPVYIGDGAYTAAGSVITDDVPPGAMAVATAAIVSSGKGTQELAPVSLACGAQAAGNPGHTIRSMWPPLGWRHSRNSSIRARASASLFSAASVSFITLSSHPVS